MSKKKFEFSAAEAEKINYNRIERIGDSFTFYGFLIHFFEALKKEKKGREKGMWKAESTTTQYLSYYDRIAENLVDHDKKTIDEYTDDDYIECIKKIKEASDGDSTVYACKRLIKCVVDLAAKRGYCDDVIHFSKFFKEEQTEEAKKKIRNGKVKRFISPDQEKRIVKDFLDIKKMMEDTKLLGLSGMYYLGGRNAEICGLTFGDFYEKDNRYYCRLYKSVKKDKSLKMGGKTPNMFRRVPVALPYAELVRARKQIVEEKIQKDNLELDVNSLPVACGIEITDFLTTCDLTYRAEMLFKEIGITSNDLFELADTLKKEEKENSITGEPVIMEKDPTAYLFRRLFVTHMSLIGLSQNQIRYLVGHSLEDYNEERKFYNNEDELEKMARMMERRAYVMKTYNKEEVFMDSYDVRQPINQHNVAKIKVEPGDIVKLRFCTNMPKENIVANFNGGLFDCDVSTYSSSIDLKSEIDILKEYYKYYGNLTD